MKKSQSREKEPRGNRTIFWGGDNNNRQQLLLIASAFKGRSLVLAIFHCYLALLYLHAALQYEA